MTSSVYFVGSIAASGNSGAIVITPDESVEYFEFRVSAKYAAVAGTTGVQMVVTLTYLGGQANVVLPTVVAPGTAGVVTSAVIRSTTKSFNGPISSISVTLTNLDGTNAAPCALDVQSHKE
jgi:hypothetical protein